MEIALIVIAAVIVLLFAAWLLMAKPRRRRPEAEAYSRVRYAHRGLYGNGVPENSCTAFRLAVEAGYGIELDLQTTKDGEVVVFHDGTLKRMCGESVAGGVIDYTLSELSRMRLAGTDERIPTFTEVLKLVGGKVPLCIEIKNDGDGIDTTRRTLDILEHYEGPYCIESFNPLIIRYVKKHAPHIVRGVLSQRFFKHKDYRKPLHFMLGILAFNFLAKPDFIAFNGHHAASLPLRYARKCGAFTLAWTVASEEDEAYVRSHGFDSVIFEKYLPKDVTL